MSRISAFLFIYFSFLSIMTSQNFNSQVEAIIQTNNDKNDFLEITGIAKNKTAANFTISYELSVITSDDSNNSSKNAQSGLSALEPYEVQNLSKTSILVNPTQRTIILLLIYDEDKKIIGTARKVFDEGNGDTKEQLPSATGDNDGLLLTGLVTENTKTKFGKDFYDFFYQKYSMSGLKEKKIVRVEEMISFGRTTRILVKIDQTTIFQFLAKPSLDFLKQMANQAVLNVNRYFEKMNRQEELITQY